MREERGKEEERGRTNVVTIREFISPLPHYIAVNTTIEVYY